MVDSHVLGKGRVKKLSYHLGRARPKPDLCFSRLSLTFYRVFQLTIPSELRGKFARREGGGVQDFRRCGEGMGRGGRHTYS